MSIEIGADRDEPAGRCRHDGSGDAGGETRVREPRPRPTIRRRPGNRAGVVLRGADHADRDEAVPAPRERADLRVREGPRVVRDWLPLDAVSRGPEPGVSLEDLRTGGSARDVAV